MAWASRHGESHERSEAAAWLDEHVRIDSQTTAENPGILPVPILGTATFGPPIQLQPDESKPEFLTRAREAVTALGGTA